MGNPGRTTLGVAAVVAVVVALPFVAPPPVLGIAVFAAIFALPAIGANLLMGLGGQVSLGQAAFFAIGAYTHAVCLTRYDVPATLSALLGVAAATVAAALLGAPLMRLRGHYLALATLGLGFIVMIAVRESEVTGRTTGIYGIERREILGVQIANNALFLWYVTPFVLVGLVLALNLSRSRAGRALSAVNDSELAAESLGVDTFRLRLQVFVLSAAFAAVGGVFYAEQVRIVTPEVSGFHFSVEILLMAVIGGLASPWGALAGAVLVEALGDGLRELIPAVLPGATGQVQLLGYGIVLVLVIIALPGGLHQVVVGAVARLRRHPGRGAVATGPPPPPGGGVQVSTPLARGETLLEVDAIRKTYGGVVAVDDVSFSVPAGTILGLIGPNGAGKTTCFNLISGAIEPSAGSVRLLSRDIAGRAPHVGARLGVTRTFQNLQTFTSTDVAGNVYMGRYRLGRAGFLRGSLGLQATEQGAHQQTARTLLDELGLGDVAGERADSLPFGRQRMMEITRALAAEPALLLLDEPMAGLSGAERDRLAALLRRLRDMGLTIVLVEHDVDQVMSLADAVVVLDDGVLIANGPPDQVRDDPAVVLAYLGTDAQDATAELRDLTAGGER